MRPAPYSRSRACTAALSVLNPSPFARSVAACLTSGGMRNGSVRGALRLLAGLDREPVPNVVQRRLGLDRCPLGSFRLDSGGEVLNRDLVDVRPPRLRLAVLVKSHREAQGYADVEQSTAVVVQPIQDVPCHLRIVSGVSNRLFTGGVRTPARRFAA